MKKQYHGGSNRGVWGASAPPHPLFELNASHFSFNDFDNKAFLLSLQWEQVFNVSPISAPPLAPYPLEYINNKQSVISNK